MDLCATRLYDFCDPKERGEWLDIFIALIEYLRSGESHVGYLNARVEKNMIHKEIEDKEVAEAEDRTIFEAEVDAEEETVTVGELPELRRSKRIKPGLEVTKQKDKKPKTKG